MKDTDKKPNRFETAKKLTDNEGLKASIADKQKHLSTNKPVNK